jgi:hypothetical protein
MKHWVKIKFSNKLEDQGLYSQSPRNFVTVQIFYQLASEQQECSRIIDLHGCNVVGLFVNMALKGYLVNCLEHFFLYFFWLQIKFPQLFAMFQILF